MFSYYVMAPVGIGKIRNLPFELGDYVRYNIHKQGLIDLSVGLKRLCEILFEAGATALYPSIGGVNRVNSKAELHLLPNFIKKQEMTLMTIHLMGSCPMGENQDICAVDSFGKLHDTEGVYITDSSILCDALGYNPQGTMMAIVRRNVLKFLSEV